ncbi:MAG: metallophosphoesterase [Muribaculaceae bacterium]|nr:metallophosphoesterase [Muribaculaceae bacterium]
MAVVIGIVSILIDIFIFFDIKRRCPGRTKLRYAYAISSVCCWIMIAVAILMPYRSSTQSITWIMWILFTYITIYASKTVYLICSLAGYIPLLWRSRRLASAKWIGVPLSIIVFCLLWWGALVTRRQINIVNVTYVSDRLPEAFDGYKIVQISDLHLGTWGEETRFISAFVDSVNAQHPDLILFTGDIVNRQTTEMAPFLSTLTRLKARDGVYSVLGNHDYGDYINWDTAQEKAENMTLMKAWQRQIGWRMLNNETVDIINGGDTIKLIGVENWGEPPFRQYGHLTDAYSISRDSVCNLMDRRFKILMTHNPEHWRRESSEISNINLTLSGHTHAMQMAIEIGSFRWSPAVLKYEEWGGLYRRNNRNGEPVDIYVNVGAGEVGMPFRLGAAKPEITVITLRLPSSECECSTPRLVK